MYRRLSNAWCLIALAAGAAIAQIAPVDDNALYGGQLIIAANGGTLADSPSVWILNQKQALLAPKLLWRTPDGGFLPGIVRHWNTDSDGLGIQLTLAPPEAERAAAISAADIAASLQYLLRNPNQSAAARLLQDIEGADAWIRGGGSPRGIQVVDEHTLHLRFIRPQPLVLDALAEAVAAPVWDESGSEIPGRGPFIADASGTVAANVRCPAGRPFLDRIMYATATPAAATRGGTARIELRPGAPGMRSLVYPGRRVVWLVANPASSILRTADLRRLVYDHLDVDGMVRIFFGGADARLRTLVPPAMVPGGLLSSGSRPGGRGNLQASSLRIGHPRGQEDLRLAAERVRVDLMLAGVRCEVVAFDNQPPRNCDLIIFDALIHEGSPEYSLWRALARLEAITGSRIWTDPKPELDAVRWLLSTDRSLRTDGWILPLFQTIPVISLDPRLRNVQFYADGTLRLDDAWISPRSEHE